MALAISQEMYPHNKNDDTMYYYTTCSRHSYGEYIWGGGGGAMGIELRIIIIVLLTVNIN